MADTIQPSPIAPEAGTTPNHSADRADLRPENIQDAVIRLAGNSQDGIQTAGAFLARLAGRSDQDVMTYMTIPSTISGGPSIFQVRIGSGEVLVCARSAKGVSAATSTAVTRDNERFDIDSSTRAKRFRVCVTHVDSS